MAGLFTEREAAVAAIDDLKAAGFSPEDVGIAMRDKGQQGDLAEETGAKAAGAPRRAPSAGASWAAPWASWWGWGPWPSPASAR